MLFAMLREKWIWPWRDLEEAHECKVLTKAKDVHHHLLVPSLTLV